MKITSIVISDPFLGYFVRNQFDEGDFMRLEAGRGHGYDYIASAPDKYANYVSQLYGILSSMNGGGETHPEWLSGLIEQANNFSNPGFFDFFDTSGQNGMEVDALRNLPGGFNENSHNDYSPEDPDPTKKLWNGWTQSHDAMQKLMDKIKRGVSGCCRPTR